MVKIKKNLRRSEGEVGTERPGRHVLSRRETVKGHNPGIKNPENRGKIFNKRMNKTTSCTKLSKDLFPNTV